MVKRLFPVVFFLVIAVLFFSFSKNLSLPFDYIARLAHTPREFLYSVSHAETKPTELDLLEKENINLRAKLVMLDALKKDNNALRSQFEDTTLPSQSLLPAKVIGAKNVSILPTILILDQGENSNVKKGMAAIQGHILLGKIGKVTRFTSELILTTSKKFATLGAVSESGASGVIMGEDDFIIMDHVVITDTIQKGETVISKGEKDIPADLLIGKITAVNKSESSPFQSAFIKPFVNFGKLRTVFIVK